jgi:predicted ester cyclase
MTPERMFQLAQALALAKSHQDVPAALKLLHPTMLLESPAFGTRAQGLLENEQVLKRFFASFPDYHVELHDYAANATSLVCWGNARMTMTGERFGVTPNGAQAVLPVFIRFTFADDLIASECFFFDLASLCAQSGVSTDAVRKKLWPAAGSAARAADASLSRVQV